MSGDNLIGMREVAKILGCSRPHLSRLCAGKVDAPLPIPYFRIGIKLMFREESIFKWIRECEAAHSAAAEREGTGD